MPEGIIRNQKTRKELTKSSFYYFFHIYFSHYITCPTGNFQKEIYKILEDFEIKFVEILAFRGSAKSTIAMLGLPIWAVVTGRRKFPILLADTFSQVKLHIYNLKTELENNRLLMNDWGPFEINEEWTATNIVLPRYDARIAAKSTGQKIRGMRHKQYRPDLVIADDIENVEDVRTKEQRDKSFRWFIGEVIPALSNDAKKVLIGNLLHMDSLMMKIKKQIENGERDGVKLEYPIIDENGKITWEGLYPNQEAIERKKREVNDMRTWQREYLLKLVPEEGQEIREEWIKYYDEFPEEGTVEAKGTGVDLAISKKDTADYTAMVSGKLVTTGDKVKIYIMPRPTNQRLTFHETMNEAAVVSKTLGGGEDLAPLFVEDVAYQKAAIEEMQARLLPVKGVKITTDKRARVREIASYVQNGTVLFPRKGCEDLLIQLLGFGIEAHDDLVDGFTLLVKSLIVEKLSGIQIESW